MSHDLFLLLDRHLSAENAHDLAGTLATLTEDCVFVDHALGMQWSGRDGAAAHYTMWWSAFDTEVVGERLHMAEASAVAETTWKGTHVGEFMGISPTGTSVELTVAVVVEFRDGRMSGERFYWDVAGLARQLGVNTIVAATPEAGPR